MSKCIDSKSDNYLACQGQKNIKLGKKHFSHSMKDANHKTTPKQICQELAFNVNHKLPPAVV